MGMRLHEEEPAVFERKMRRDDHVPRPDRPTGCLDHTGVAVLDIGRRGLLEDVAPVAGDHLGQAEQVLTRVKLRLVVEPNRRRDPVGERRLLHELDG